MNAAWDGRPQNPDRDGAHVVQFSYGTDKAGLILVQDPITAYWMARAGAWQFGSDKWRRSPQWMSGNSAIYLGPCLTPAEHEALVTDIARKDAALREIAAADEGPGEWHINGVFVGRIARAALAPEPDA